MRDPIHIVQPTVTVDTNAYADGDALHTGALVLDVATDAVPYALLMPPVLTSDTATAATTFDVIFYGSNPSASTITANSAHSIHASDDGKIIGCVKLDQVIVDGGCTIHFANAQPIAVRSSNGLVYCSIIVRGSPTLAATDITFTVPVMRQG